MYFNSIYTKGQLDKLGNAIIFLCEQIGPLSKIKLLKLVYLIEESSVKKYGAPFFNLRFDVWKSGPVSRDLYAELTEPSLLEEYIEREIRNGNIFIKAKKNFCDDEFSDLEIALLGQIVTTFKNATTDELINLTHRKHSPWYIAAQAHGLLAAFENGLAGTSDVEIDLSTVLANDPEKSNFYNGHREFLEQSMRLKV